ncbi:hypothetical protein BJ912DRAFT_949255 [Pholiota molesta]|nr:hypothetical protein BJ912DRAFT_949255 [Pholiota molesta]
MSAGKAWMQSYLPASSHNAWVFFSLFRTLCLLALSMASDRFVGHARPAFRSRTRCQSHSYSRKWDFSHYLQPAAILHSASSLDRRPHDARSHNIMHWNWCNNKVSHALCNITICSMYG